MSCKTTSDRIDPATIVHLMTRHQAEKYLFAPRTDPEAARPNSQTHPIIKASEPKKTRS